MGGRGTWSMTYDNKKYMIHVGDASSVAALGKVDNSPDPRGDIKAMFSEIGFASIGGTAGINTAILGALAIQLNNLERQYGAIGSSGKVTLMTADGSGFKAAVGYDSHGNQSLILNPKAFSSVSAYNKQIKAEQAAGSKMPTDGSVKNNFRYTVTHEYGHMLQNSMYRKAVSNGYRGTPGRYAQEVKDSIIKTASTRYGGTQKSLSHYGATNSSEFFAEAFASAHLGKPTAVGKAMQDWLKSNGS